MRYRIFQFLFFFILSQQVLFAQETKWTSLFNGKDLKGWVQYNGKAKYTVENGEIVGRTVPDEPNSFLSTDKLYGDFILELDLKVDEHMNSGIQFRSELNDENEERGSKMSDSSHSLDCDIECEK
jgi:hypothetical protein